MSQEIIHAYRHLLRTSLHAIRHAKPARFTLVAHLRNSFRASTHPYDGPTTTRTLEFLTNAAKYKGVEEKIVRNLMVVWGCRGRDVPTTLRREKGDVRYRDEAYGKFHEDIGMLERALGIRLTGGDMSVPIQLQNRVRKIPRRAGQ